VANIRYKDQEWQLLEQRTKFRDGVHRESSLGGELTERKELMASLVIGIEIEGEERLGVALEGSVAAVHEIAIGRARQW
jgi:hypothetical protein